MIRRHTTCFLFQYTYIDVLCIFIFTSIYSIYMSIRLQREGGRPEQKR